MEKSIELFLNSVLLKANGIDFTGIRNLREYIIQNHKSLLSEKAIKKVQSFIMHESGEDNLTMELIMCRILQNYVFYNFNPEFSFIRYLQNTDINEVIDVVRSHDALFHDLILAYYNSYRIKASTPPKEAIDLIDKIHVSYKVRFLSSLIRENFEILYNTFLYNANDSIKASQLIDLCIYHNIPIFGDKQIESAIAFLRSHKDFLSRLIYSDIYQDLVANNVEHDLNKPAARIIAQAVIDEKFVLPKDLEERRIIFNYFAYLCTCDEQRKSNHGKIPVTKEAVLNKINPLWKLDESDIIIKR